MVSNFSVRIGFHFGLDYFVEIITLLYRLIKHFCEILIILSIHSERISSQYEKSFIEESDQEGRLENFEDNFALSLVFNILA